MNPLRKLLHKVVYKFYRVKQRVPFLRFGTDKAVLELAQAVSVQNGLKDSKFTQQGYEVFENFLDPETCDSLHNAFDGYLYDSLPAEESGAYVVERKYQPLDNYDKQVYQLMNIHQLDGMSEICDSIRPKLEGLLQERIGKPVYCNSFTLQRDFPDDQTKRPYHNDGYFVAFKAFVYLTDVPERKNGPYTVVPGSHKHFFRKLYCIFNNAKRGNKRHDDLFQAYDDKNAVTFCGKKGTMILSTQTLAHKGWQGHTEGARDVMVVYIHLTPTTEWTLGKNLAMHKPLSLAHA